MNIDDQDCGVIRQMLIEAGRKGFEAGRIYEQKVFMGDCGISDFYQKAYVEMMTLADMLIEKLKKGPFDGWLL